MRIYTGDVKLNWKIADKIGVDRFNKDTQYRSINEVSDIVDWLDKNGKSDAQYEACEMLRMKLMEATGNVSEDANKTSTDNKSTNKKTAASEDEMNEITKLRIENAKLKNEVTDLKCDKWELERKLRIYESGQTPEPSEDEIKRIWNAFLDENDLAEDNKYYNNMDIRKFIWNYNFNREHGFDQDIEFIERDYIRYKKGKYKNNEHCLTAIMEYAYCIYEGDFGKRFEFHRNFEELIQLLNDAVKHLDEKVVEHEKEEEESRKSWQRFRDAFSAFGSAFKDEDPKFDEIRKLASENNIDLNDTKAKRKLSKITHPDITGGDDRMQKLVNEYFDTHM